MHRGGLMDATVLQCSVKGPTDTPIGDGNPSESLGWVNGAHGGKEPAWMAMGPPVRAEQHECLLRQGDIAVFAALAGTNMDVHPRTIDLGNLKVRSFMDA